MSKKTVFDFAAQVGLTKHMGGLEATDEIVAQCHIGAGKLILDVGCGVGMTACCTPSWRMSGKHWMPRLMPGECHPDAGRVRLLCSWRNARRIIRCPQRRSCA
jgi:hypothetical protein